MSCGLWTEELLSKYKVMQRASAAVDISSDTAMQREVLSLTAKSHGLYWLFVPGFAILTKMATYLNENPTWIFIGQHFEEVPRLNEKMPRVEYKICESGAEATRFDTHMHLEHTNGWRALNPSSLLTPHTRP